VAVQRGLELLGAREALGERLLDDPLERQVGEGAGEVDDGDRGNRDGQALQARDVAGMGAWLKRTTELPGLRELSHPLNPFLNEPLQFVPPRPHIP